MDQFWGVIEQYNRLRNIYESVNDAHVIVSIILGCGAVCLVTGQLFQLAS